MPPTTPAKTDDVAYTLLLTRLQSGEGDDQLPEDMQVAFAIPESEYPTLHVNVLTLKVTPVVSEIVPKAGALKAGHNLAAQVGAGAVH